MYRENYFKIMVGLVFLIDIRIGSIDILPDFFGYLIISVALTSLSSLNGMFRKAKIKAIILIVLTIPDMFIVTLPMYYSDYNSMELPIMIWFIGLAIISLRMVSNVVEGMVEQLKEQGLLKLARGVRICWWVYLIPNSLVLLVFYYSLIGGLTEVVIVSFCNISCFMLVGIIGKIRNRMGEVYAKGSA